MRYLNSERLADFHPLLTSMTEFPEWDSIDLNSHGEAIEDNWGRNGTYDLWECV